MLGYDTRDTNGIVASSDPIIIKDLEYAFKSCQKDRISKCGKVWIFLS